MSRILNSDPQAGFSLLEACIALAVMGTLLSVMLPAYGRLQQRQAWQRTQENLKQVEEALLLHFRHKNALPYPVDATGNPLEDQTVGYIPYRNLDLPERATWDGAHHPMRYAVHQALVARNKGPTYFPRPEQYASTPGAPQVTDAHGHPVIREDSALAWVLVAGTQSDHPDECQNLDNTMCFVDRPFSTNPHAPFRHHIRYQTVASLQYQAFPGRDPEKDSSTDHSLQAQQTGNPPGTPIGPRPKSRANIY